MSKQDNNTRAKCPVCGRFCKQEAVDKYNGLLNERVRIAKELDEVAVELGDVRKALVDAKETCDAAVKRAEDYEALYIDTRGKLDKADAKLAESGLKLTSMQSECLRLSAENERLYNRGLWARILNKRV